VEAATHTDEHRHHHEMPTSGRALTSVAIAATLHCLTGCAIGEIVGMIIGTAFNWSNGGTIAISIVLAFVFGYGLTSMPLLRAGLALAAVIPIALASDTLSIATMELIDNTVIVAIPGAMHAGLGDLLFWGSLSFSLAVAGVVAVPVNRYLIARGKGHAVVHETGIHGGPSPRLVGAIAAVGFVFGATVLVVDAVSSDESEHGAGHMQAGAHGAGKQDPVRGLAASANGTTLELARTELPLGRRTELRFKVVGRDGRALRDFEVEHERRMHFIVARRDMTGFQHLHPRMSADGTWSTPITVDQAGSYRMYADFKRHGKSETLASDVGVDGAVDWSRLPAPAATATTADGYTVRVAGGNTRAGAEAELAFTVRRGGKPVRVERYLGAGGHLVALRQGDMAYLHVHPTGGPRGAEPVKFMTEFPSAGAYRLFLQFKAAGRVHTAAFTRTYR
jgi:hypothetical protein